MNPVIQRILEYSAGFGVPLTLLWAFGRDWLLKRLELSIKSKYDEKLELYRAELKHASELELAHLKSNLEIKAAERNTRFSRVFEETAKVIAKTYALLVETSNAANSFASYLGKDEKQQTEAGEAFKQKYTAFYEYYDLHQIYIPKQTRDKVKDFSNAIADLASKTAIINHQARSGFRNDAQLLAERIQLLFNQVPNLRTMLEDEFQKQLGLVGENQMDGSVAALNRAGGSVAFVMSEPRKLNA